MSEASTIKRAPRRDAQARREALISAAADCFSEIGYTVPLEEIADRAGVGRGTVYRNFKDREALALAIFEREIDHMEAELDPEAPFTQTLATIIRGRTPSSALYSRIAAELQLDDENVAALLGLAARMEAMLAPFVARAQARGELAASVTASDIVLAVRMVGGLRASSVAVEESDERIRAALQLLFEGLRPR